jgi:hypothetical protein
VTDEPHVCFSASTTAYLRNLDPDENGDVWAVHYQAPPKRNEAEGTTSFSLNFPTLIVTGYLAEPQKIAEKVARILEEHWSDDDEQA